jgi:FHS family L-fucose permease-like MFS transporter
MLFLTLFFESVCFPTIVALGIRGLGRHYKRGSGFIVGGVSGGAVVPPILGHVADMRNNTGFAMIVPTMFMVVAWTYAVAVNFVPSYRDTVDKVGESEIGLQGDDDATKEKDVEVGVMGQSRAVEVVR